MRRLPSTSTSCLHSPIALRVPVMHLPVVGSPGGGDSTPAPRHRGRRDRKISRRGNLRSMSKARVYADVNVIRPQGVLGLRVPRGAVGVKSAARDSMGRTWKRKQRAEDIQEGKEVSMRPDAEATQEERRGERRPPNKLKFWVDQDLEKHCFLLLAQELSITWIDNEQYWGWIDQKEKCFSGEVDIPAAELLEVCWLSIWGKFKTIMLSPKTTYEVAFVVKMNKNSRGWHAPVNPNLTLPDGTTQGRIENLDEKQKGGWIDILAGIDSGMHTCGVSGRHQYLVEDISMGLG